MLSKTFVVLMDLCIETRMETPSVDERVEIRAGRHVNTEGEQIKSKGGFLHAEFYNFVMKC